ncbi:MAG: hypothetical protein JNM38_10460 [Acidobacteria bacterium]|nr:hypothetical protein [Acidobacteriota bacterium]
MLVRISLALLTLSLAVSPALAQAPAGGESPQAVVEAIQRASAADDLGAAVRYIAPDARRELVKEGVTGLLMALAFSDPDDAMPGSKTPPRGELDKKRKDYKAAVDQVSKLLSAHGITGVIGKPVLAEATQKPIDAALQKADTAALMRDMLTALDTIGPLLGMTKSDKPKVPFQLGKVSGYKVTGDTATAKAEKETLDFVRIAGRWYLTPPAGRR